MAREQRKQIDMEVFRSIVGEFILAASHDVSYAVAMSRAACAIEKKRDVWSTRLEVRRAEEKARTECSKAESFSCSNESPCGVGNDCKFSQGDLRQLDVPVCYGSTIRPQASSTGTYSIEPAVQALREFRLNRESDE